MILKSAALTGLVWLGAFAAESPKVTTTFYKDVMPVLQQRCQECHRAGEIAPMPFLTYEQVRPWAKSIKSAVLTRKMPPWFADPAFGHFSNDRSLTQPEMDTLVAWVDGGAREGNRKDAPEPRRFVDGWNIPKPDLALAMPNAIEVPAKGELSYQYVILPTGFKEDKWIQAVEIRPGTHAVVHHIVAFVREPQQKWLRNEAEPGIAFVPPKKDANGNRRLDLGGAGSEMLAFYAPGQVPEVWRTGLGKRVKAGSDIVLQIHYTADGKVEHDQSKVGMVFAKEPPEERSLGLAAVNVMLRIPAGEPNYETRGSVVLPNGGTILSLFPHMHLRGKAFEFKAKYPTGESETLLKVNNYDFNWQLSYKLAKPITVPPGTRIECTGWFDNSPNNARNPDPTSEVRFGEQSWEEMLVGYFDVQVPRDTTLMQVLLKQKAD
ncbi:MAG: thiol-disulfide isomerase [Acidobacteriota bacterium]|nr:thiol-disulfide isomerase [Acidobacteriota bacterium]